ncbi:MAG TPA: methyltransferase domain-containing protein [Nitrospira sp.]|nr:methyltransferase domain-containing protein [Nitrospira sp.]
MSRDAHDEIRTAASDLDAHLALWGLRRFTSDPAYFLWQRQTLSPQELSTLHAHVERKRRGSEAEEIAFYDATAHPRILPVLYSQRYEYYLIVGPRIAMHIPLASRVLDFGCGVGILTTFYAKRYPETSFVGLDRSPGSIERARQQALALGLRNVRFDCVDILRDPLPGTFDVIVATHALVQAEQDPGVPSRDWTTFERKMDPRAQHAFEERTGIGGRLDRLAASLAPGGRMIVFEKTRQLSRRVPFQRALAARGLSLMEPPVPLRYHLVEEVSDDGPLYVVRRGGAGIAWDEGPEPDEGRPVDSAMITRHVTAADEPLYENHYASAQQAWERLRGRSILKERTEVQPDGRQWHAELGQAEEGWYLYCANTFDQRQLVITDSQGAGLLETYYREIMEGSPAP